jgi:hypothetical protein
MREAQVDEHVEGHETRMLVTPSAPRVVIRMMELDHF